MKVTTIAIASGLDAAPFAKDCNSLISQGFQPWGSPSHAEGEFYLVFVKYEVDGKEKERELITLLRKSQELLLLVQNDARVIWKIDEQQAGPEHRNFLPNLRAAIITNHKALPPPTGL